MHSHKPQLPGNALLHWAGQQCCGGSCSCLAPSSSGCCQHQLANPPKARNFFKRSLPPEENRVPPILQNTWHYFSPIRLFAAKHTSDGTRGCKAKGPKHPRGDWPGMLLQVKLVLWAPRMGPAHWQDWLHRVPLQRAACENQCDWLNLLETC